MLLLKGFFRKKSTIIYMIIYSVILAAIISLFTLIKYNQNMINDIVKKNSYILLSSTNDYYNEILKNKNIIGIDRIIQFMPNNKYDVFKNSGISITTPDGIEIEKNTQNERKIDWEDYTENSNSIIITSDKNKDFKLKNDEIALSLHKSVEKKSELFDDIIGKKLAFFYNNEEIEFTIKRCYETTQNEMTISEEKFKSLTQMENGKYVYKIYLKNYEEANKNVNELKQLNNNDNELYVELFYKIVGNQDSEMNSNAKNLVNSFEIACFIVITIFIFVFIIVSKNILNDENKNLKLESALGYNKIQARKYSVMKLLTLVLASFAIATIIYYIFNIIILHI